MIGINVLKPYSLKVGDKFYPVKFEKYKNVSELDNNIRQKIAK